MQNWKDASLLSGKGNMNIYNNNIANEMKVKPKMGIYTQIHSPWYCIYEINSNPNYQDLK